MENRVIQGGLISQFKVPILLLLFNRPDKTKHLINSLKSIRPSHLYVAIDGPRPGDGDDLKRILQVKDVLSTIDWACTLELLGREENLGCKVAVSEAISWFFGRVNEGIILEDDCIPEASFFEFCEFFIAELRQDKSVAMIGGSNLLSAKLDFNNKAFRVRFPSVWGWATWADRWQLYDVNMTDWPSMRGFILNRRFRLGMRNYINRVFNGTHDGSIDTWDYQLAYMMAKYQLDCILPPVNLVSNIGLGDSNSTHPSDPNDFYAPLKKNISAPYLLSRSKIVTRLVNFIIEDEFLAPSRLRPSRRFTKLLSWFLKRYI